MFGFFFNSCILLVLISFLVLLGFLAVCATLKLQFAKSIALGSAIASILNPPSNRYLLPFLNVILPVEYRKWAQPIIDYVIHSIAISLAWYLQRIISAFHSALRGGNIFGKNIIQYLNEMKIIDFNDNDTLIDEYMGYAIAVIGFIFQFTFGFNVS